MQNDVALKRFHNLTTIDDTTGCVVWVGALTNGYGRFGHAGRVVYAHRWSYEQFVGPIPDGLVIDHLCRRPACVNPLHLRAVTQSQNLHADRSLARAKRNAEATHCPSGHEYDDANTYRPPRGGRQCRICVANHHSNYRARKRELHSLSVRG